MSFNLSKKLEKYNINTNSICIKNLGIKPENICENVVIAPFYSVKALKNINENININCLFEKYYKIYSCSFNNKEFLYINSNMCAGNIAEILCSLAGTKCKNIYFIGSSGSLINNLKIGDVAIPTESIIGDGTCRYFNNGKDLFGEISRPNKNLLNKTCSTLKELGINYSLTKNFSTDTISGQFLILKNILGYKSETIEMETSAFYYIAKKLNFNAIAIHNISDTPLENKSLYNGRSDVDKNMKKQTQNTTIPKILCKILLDI